MPVGPWACAPGVGDCRKTVAFTSQIFWECICVLGEGSGRGKSRDDELVGPCSGPLRNAKEAGLWLSYA